MNKNQVIEFLAGRFNDMLVKDVKRDEATMTAYMRVIRDLKNYEN